MIFEKRYQKSSVKEHSQTLNVFFLLSEYGFQLVINEL